MGAFPPDNWLSSHSEPRHPKDLARHVFVNMQSYSVEVRLLGPRGGEVVAVAGPIVANDMHLARQLVEQGAGVGPLVFPPGDRPSLGKSLVRVRPDYVIEGPKLFMAAPSRSKNQPLRVQLLREFLSNAYAPKS